MSEIKSNAEIVLNVLSEEVERISGHEEEPYVRGTIHKVPHFLRHGNEGAYTPKLVSIGPYHRGENALAEMEDIKLRYFLDFTRRSGGVLQDYIAVVEQNADKAMVEYSAGGLGLDRTEFVKTMVIDCCFILEFLVKWFVSDRKSQAKTLMTKLPILRNDLLLVENQVPFFLLESMFGKFNTKKITNNKDLRLVALAFFMGDKDDARVWVKSRRQEEEFDHLLHLYHTSLTQPPRPSFEWINECAHFFGLMGRPTDDSDTSSCFLKGFRVLSMILTIAGIIIFWIVFGPLLGVYVVLATPMVLLWTCVILTVRTRRVQIGGYSQPKTWLSGIPNACNLRDTGFSFQKRYAKEYDFMDVSRSGNKIKIPLLCIRESTLVLFRNLIALEQCSNKYGNKFTAYSVFMDYLVDTREDVAMLKESGIIDNRLGDDQKVADFFNDLCKGIRLDDDEHYLSALFNHVTEYYTSSKYKVRLYRWRKRFIPDYFTNPWAIPSMIAALTLLTLSALQTFYAIYAYYRPPSPT